jgi:hypothetical protein
MSVNVEYKSDFTACAEEALTGSNMLIKSMQGMIALYEDTAAKLRERDAQFQFVSQQLMGVHNELNRVKEELSKIKRDTPLKQEA